ncbi:nitrate reductase gamma subunit [Sphingomonas naasensis]|uniref:Ferrochelatase n=1 Tax=Sphingomonas naasensis TaxID=1344951 RepID=A0A4S1WB07_9SPHN|nr:hypothetical protein [Sphingomonas naasensis]NIJ19886.1 nitrate reductase gamma subunit [Sphingomonas naasensis]TGX39989.1 hypothetical protein E5A74_15530 [Sphingomonas naasensis]
MRTLKLVAASALTFGAASVPVAQASTSMLSLQRAATAGEKSSDLNGSVAIILIATAAIIGTAIYVSTNDDDEPDSP